MKTCGLKCLIVEEGTWLEYKEFFMAPCLGKPYCQNCVFWCKRSSPALRSWCLIRMYQQSQQQRCKERNPIWQQSCQQLLLLPVARVLTCEMEPAPSCHSQSDRKQRTPNTYNIPLQHMCDTSCGVILQD